MLSLFYVILFVISGQLYFSLVACQGSHPYKGELHLYVFVLPLFFFFLMSGFERVVRAFRMLMPELPLLSKTPNDYRCFQRATHFWYQR